MDKSDIEDPLAALASELRRENLTEALEVKVRSVLIDQLACTVAGLSHPLVHKCQSVLHPATACGSFQELSTLGAPDQARVLSIAGHVLEMDDLAATASLHPGTVVIPAALTIAQRVGSSALETMKAIVFGYEVMIKVGEIIDPGRHYGLGFHPTATCGVFGAAAAAAYLLGLDEEKLQRSLGLAATSASGTLSYLNDGAETKAVQVGNSTGAGVAAALLVSGGVRAPTTALSGRFGFLQAYAPYLSGQHTEVADSDEPAILCISQKPYACCRYAQPGVDLVLTLATKHRVDVETIRRIEVATVDAAIPIVCEPIEQKIKPKTVPAAQFSLPFCVAASVLHGRLYPQDLEEALEDPRTAELAGKVSYRVDSHLNDIYPQQWGAVVKVELEGGASLTARADDSRGDPTKPFSDETLLEKAVGLTDAPSGNGLVEAVRLYAAGTTKDLLLELDKVVQTW